MDLERDVIVEVREGNAVLSADWLTDDDLVDVIELIPVLVPTQRTKRAMVTGSTKCDLHQFSCISVTTSAGRTIKRFI